MCFWILGIGYLGPLETSAPSLGQILDTCLFGRDEHFDIQSMYLSQFSSQIKAINKAFLYL